MAMENLNLRYNVLNAQLTRYLDQLERGALADSPELRVQLVQDFILRGDAQNYLVFGDPAVTLRISES